MARPRVFISSTFYDLKHIRADLDRFFDEMGYDAIRNEKGDIPYGNIENLEEYCYREVYDVDILVGIIGNRYGSDSTHGSYSITQQEIKTAYEHNKQVYIFIEKNVFTEFETYLLNKQNNIQYKYVDNVLIYKFIEEINTLKAGIIIQPFEHAIDITGFLKSQWAGLFREYLRQNSNQKQLESLSQKIAELSSITDIVKQYFEKALPTIMKDDPSVSVMIEEKNKELSEEIRNDKINTIGYIKHLNFNHKISLNRLVHEITSTNSLIELVSNLKKIQLNDSGFYCLDSSKALSELNEARAMLKLPPFIESISEIKEWLNKNPDIGYSNRLVNTAVNRLMEANTKKTPAKKTMRKK